MTEGEKAFSVSQDQATMTYRQLRAGSSEIGTLRERTVREKLQDQLGIDKTTTSSPDTAVLGQLLIAYIAVSTRLICDLEATDRMAVKDKINRQLSVPDGETPQETFDRLLGIAIENSQLINSRSHL